MQGKKKGYSIGPDLSFNVGVQTNFTFHVFKSCVALLTSYPVFQLHLGIDELHACPRLQRL